MHNDPEAKSGARDSSSRLSLDLGLGLCPMSLDLSPELRVVV